MLTKKQKAFMWCNFLQRVHLNIRVGEHAVDYQQIVAKDKLNDLQLRMRQLMDQVEQINKEQAYQRVSHQCVHLIISLGGH